MKRRSPTGTVTHIAVPPEPVQGLQPSADYTRVSQQLIARQNQHGALRESVKVEGMGQSRLALNMTRVSDADVAAQAQATSVRLQADQQRGLADALSFEARARAAGALGRPTPDDDLRARARAAERAHVYRSS